MRDTLRAKLDLIDDMLLSQDGRDLYNILSALRGPDASGGAALLVKSETTAAIRGAAFPKWCNKGLYQEGL